MTGTVTASALNVRKGVGTSYPVVTTLKGGTVVMITGSAKNTDGITWYKTPKGWVSGRYIKLNSTISSPSKPINEVTSSMTFAQIQAIFKRGGNIIVRKGSYKLHGTLMCYSNSKITMEPGVYIYRMKQCPVFANYYSSYSTGYNASHDIEITGGTFIGDGLNLSGNVIVFFHGKNIKFSNFKIIRSVYSHSIEINACENVTIQNFEISDHKLDLNGAYREAIQYDFASYIALPYFSKGSRCYDNTHCKNISIINGKFKDYPTAVGTHIQSSSPYYHDGIIVKDCVITGMGNVKGYGSGVKFMNVRNSLVSNTTCQNCNRGVEVITSNRFYDKNGSVIKTRPSNVDGGCKNIVIDKLRVKNPTGTVLVSGVFIGANYKGIRHDAILIKSSEFYIKSNKKNRYAIHCVNVADHVNLISNKCDLDGNVFCVK